MGIDLLNDICDEGFTPFKGVSPSFDNHIIDSDFENEIYENELLSDMYYESLQEGYSWMIKKRILNS